MKNSKIFKLVTIGFVVISLTACGSDKISNTTNEPSTYESTVIETEATPEESEATTMEPVTTVEATTIESASVVDGDIVIDTESDSIEITETETGEKIATITTVDGNTTQVVVTENESGETIVDTTKTVTESGKVTNNTKENKTEIKVDDNGNVTVETTTTIIPEPTVTPTKPATTNKPLETTSTEPSTTEAPTTVAPTTVAPTEIPTSAEHTTTVETTASHSHSYTKTLTKTATCESDGYYTYKCSCGDSYIETIKATGHNFGSWSTTKEVTCTESGVKTRKCYNCSKTETQTITATGHNYGSWITTKSATCCENGTKTRTCSKCNNLETQTIPATGHNWTSKKIHHDEVGHYENEYKDWKEYNYYETSYYCGDFSMVPEYNTYFGPSKYLNMFNSHPSSTWDIYIYKYFNNGSVYDISKLLYSEKEDRGYTINGTHVPVYTGNIINYYTIDTSKCQDIYNKISNILTSNWSVDSNKEFETQYKYSLYETINHHDLVGQTWIIDTAAYDETIYTCSVCGITK